MHVLVSLLVGLFVGGALGYAFRTKEAQALVDIHTSLENLKAAIDAKAEAVKSDIEKHL